MWAMRAATSRRVTRRACTRWWRDGVTSNPATHPTVGRPTASSTSQPRCSAGCKTRPPLIDLAGTGVDEQPLGGLAFARSDHAHLLVCEQRLDERHEHVV